MSYTVTLVGFVVFLYILAAISVVSYVNVRLRLCFGWKVIFSMGDYNKNWDYVIDRIPERFKWSLKWMFPLSVMIVMSINREFRGTFYPTKYFFWKNYFLEFVIFLQQCKPPTLRHTIDLTRFSRVQYEQAPVWTRPFFRKLSHERWNPNLVSRRNRV